MSFYVRAEPDRRIVDPPGDVPPACDAGPRVVSLAPGQTLRFEHAWAAHGPGGTFTAYAVLDEHHVLRVLGGGEFKAGHRSNEIAITVGR